MAWRARLVTIKPDERLTPATKRYPLGLAQVFRGKRRAAYVAIEVGSGHAVFV
jgi:hypothetical protein